jgi:hypothetical protein
MKTETCADLIDEACEDRCEKITKLFLAYCDPDTADEEFYAEYGDPEHAWPDYGLDFEYVIPDDVNGRPYWCLLLLSTGGPHEEIRFYGDLLGEYDARFNCAVFVYKDWFDHAETEITGAHRATMREIFDFLAEMGSLHTTQEKALAVQ